MYVDRFMHHVLARANDALVRRGKGEEVWHCYHQELNIVFSKQGVALFESCTGADRTRFSKGLNQLFI